MVRKCHLDLYLLPCMIDNGLPSKNSKKKCSCQKISYSAMTKFVLQTNLLFFTFFHPQILPASHQTYLHIMDNSHFVLFT